MDTLKEKLLTHIEEQDAVLFMQRKELNRLSNIIAALTIAAQTDRVQIHVKEGAEHLADALVVGLHSDNKLMGFQVDYSNVNELTIDAGEQVVVDSDGKIHNLYTLDPDAELPSMTEH